MASALVRVVCFIGAPTVIALAGAASVMPAATGCSTHQCDGDSVDAPQGTTRVEGQNVVWESSPLIPEGDAGGWLDYRGLRTFVFHFPPPFAADTEITAIAPYVSSTTDPDKPTNPNFVLAAGNLAEVTALSGTGMSLQNATCAEYFLRVEVRGRLAGGEAGGIVSARDDASTE